MSDAAFELLLKRVGEGQSLDADASSRAFEAIVSGAISEVRIAAFLTALAVRKPTVDEIVGAVRTLRKHMHRVEANPYAIDLCGTGGDGQHTLNISTACSFVVAACSVPVAKHGNRSMSSKSGAADVLEALGVNIDLDPLRASLCLRDVGLCFLFAQTYHPAMKHAAAVRRELGFRTIFNLLGPLSNPAGVRRQLIGVYAAEWVEPIALALAQLGTEKAWIVHGGGMDEITTTGTTTVAVLDDGKVTMRRIVPEDAGLPCATLPDLKGGTADENAAALQRLFDGERGPYRDMVLLNSAGALVVAGKVEGLRAGVALAAEALDGGGARMVLAKLIACSNA
ncbi:MAG TPA: anthranilate phosphoribosyltransferase [Rhizomicrobium sp.]|jgi:anthranilate phosphoribosyltransferase